MKIHTEDLAFCLNLLAVTAAIYVMMVYYIFSNTGHFKFEYYCQYIYLANTHIQVVSKCGFLNLTSKMHFTFICVGICQVSFYKC